MSELLKINVNDHTEKKGGLTYLSWAWAWAEVLKADPKAIWSPIYFGKDEQDRPHICLWVGETALVGTQVTINGLARTCILPVMDNRNNAVKSPDARKISDAIMRCMTKAIAMHGLGLYIYAGEDLPMDDEPSDAAEPDSLVPALQASIEQASQRGMGALAAAAADAETRLEGYTKIALSKLAVNVKALATVAEQFDLIEDQGLNGDEKTFLWAMLDSKIRSALKREGQIRALAKVPA